MAMLIPGIKIGPKDWATKLNQSQAKLAEIWYRADKPEWYHEMFQVLHDRGVIFGLHYWGITSSGHEANLAYPGENFQESVDLVQACLNQAIDQQAAYVNIHTGNRRLMNIQLGELSQIVPDPNSIQISNDQAVFTRNQALIDLGRQAREHQVQLLVEAIPQKVATDSRLHPINQYPASLDGLLSLCQQGLIGFTNDFCHTFAFDQDNFETITQDFAPYTKLVHANTLTPPYNGTDEHRGILDDDLAQPGVFPSKDQLISLIGQIQSKSQSDLWLIGEPADHHIENYQKLQNLIKSLGLPDTDRVECPKSAF